MIDRRARRLPTSVPVPVDPEFVPLFVKHGWQRVERIYGKRRVQTWADVVGRKYMIGLRRDYLSGGCGVKTIALNIEARRG